MNIKKLSLPIVIALLAFSAGKFLSPKQVEIKEVEKIVYKERVVKDEDKKSRVERRTTTLPDGTKITETVRDSESQTRTDSSKEGSTERSKESSTTNQSQWSIGLYKSNEAYTGTIDTRILGGVFVGVSFHKAPGVSHVDVAAGLRVEF